MHPLRSQKRRNGERLCAKARKETKARNAMTGKRQSKSSPPSLRLISRSRFLSRFRAKSSRSVREADGSTTAGERRTGDGRTGTDGADDTARQPGDPGRAGAEAGRQGARV